MRKTWSRIGLLAATGIVLSLVVLSGSVQAAAPPAENPQQKSVGLQGTVSSDPPTKGATITSPTSGQTITKAPVTIAGLCTSGLLIKIFTNNVFVGSVLCVNGSYSLQVDLFEGRNDIVARIFDALDQPGPDSNIVTVTFTNSQFQGTGFPQLSLTSNYARRGTNPGELLVWPIILNGGTGPYAVSISWGDTKSATLLSLSFAGAFDISHIYDSAGVYNIVIKATDKNGVSAYLQLVGEANGAVSQTGANGSGATQTTTIIKILWIPAAVCIPLLFVAFWLGRRHELSELRKHLENVG